jgi:hypothetical protein
MNQCRRVLFNPLNTSRKCLSLDAIFLAGSLRPVYASIVLLHTADGYSAFDRRRRREEDIRTDESIENNRAFDNSLIDDD